MKGEQKNFVFDFLYKDFIALGLEKGNWRMGFQNGASDGFIAEFVTGNETVQNWTELITVQFMASMRNVDPRQYALFITDRYRDAYGDRAKVNILRAATAEALIEYRVAGQPGTRDEHTITRVIKGNTSLILVHYAAKPAMTADKRAFGLEVVEGARYYDHFPQE